MVREVITLSIGQAGIQLSQPVWQQYCAEHSIGYDALRIPRKYYYKRGPTKILYEDTDTTFKTFFEETKDKQYVPRTIMVDLEPNVIDDIKASNIKKLFNSEFLLSGTEDAANNFARGHYTVGKEMIDTFNNKLRKIVDRCDNIQCLIVNHSVGGGTGSGFGSLILENIAVDYRKKCKFGFEIYPSTTISNCVVEPYNALLTTHWLLDHTEISFILDNEAIYEICQQKLHINRPSYNDINCLIAKTVSAATSKERYEGELSTDCNEFQTNLVPFPRLHFLTLSMAPIATNTIMKVQSMDLNLIALHCFDKRNFFTKIDDFDVEEDKYMAIYTIMYNVRAKEGNTTIQWLRSTRKVTFVEWCPTGFKLSLRGGYDELDCMPILHDDTIGYAKKNVFMMGNNTAISRVFAERISKKYDLMYSQRAFVHWYVGEGMEEGQFAEAREDLGFLEKDYMDVLSTQETEEDTDEDNITINY